MSVRHHGLSLVAFAACLVGSAGCDITAADPRASASDVWERSYTLGETPTVSIANTNGAVTVEAHEGSTVEVRAERSVRAVTDAGARELLEATTITEELDGSSVSLRTRRPPSFSRGQRAEVRYEVRVPRGTSLTLRTTNGALAITGVQGVVDLETVNGRVRGSGLGQVRRAETVNGSVDLSLDRVPSDGASVETVNGSVELAFPSDVTADVAVRTVNGSISVDGFAQVDEGERRRRRYNAHLNGGGPAVHIQTVNGSVTVRGGAAPSN